MHCYLIIIYFLRGLFMVCYNAQTIFQVFRAIVHRFRYHPSDKAVLLTAGININTEISFIFNYIIKHKNYLTTIRKAPYDTIDAMEKIICDQMNEKFSSAGINLSEITEYYVTGYTNDFAAYLCKNEIKHHFMEDANGTLTKWELNQARAFEDISPVYKQLRDKYGLYGGVNDYIINKYCLLSANIKNNPEWQDDKAVNFNTAEEAKKLSAEEKDLICRLFQIDNIFQGEYLLLTEWFFDGKSQKSEDELIPLRYQLLLDYCFPGEEGIKPVVKPHPADPIDYNKYLPYCTILEKNFPSELFSVVNDKKFKRIMGISSTSLLSLTDITDELLQPGKSFIWNYRLLNSVIICLAIIEELNLGSGKIYHFAGLSDLLKFVMQYVLPSFSEYAEEWVRPNAIKKNGLYIINDFEKDAQKFGTEHLISNLLDLDDESIVFFLTSEHRYIFYDYKNPFLLPFIIPVEIKKAAMRRDTLLNANSEYLFIFSKNKKIRERIKRFKYRRELLHTGIAIQVDTYNEMRAHEILDRVISLKNPLRSLTDYVYSLEDRIKRLELIWKQNKFID